MEELFEETMTTISPNLIKVRSWWTESPQTTLKEAVKGLLSLKLLAGEVLHVKNS